jgi:hypothetical protein
MARLKHWSDDQRVRLLELMAYNRNVAEAYRALALEEDGLWEYPYNTVKAYIQSDQGREDYLIALAGVKEKVKEEGFGGSDQRLTGLVEVATQILTKFRGAVEEGEYAPMTTLSREFRETMKAIREEVGPAAAGVADVLSFFDQLKQTADSLPDAEHEALFGRAEEPLATN